jgi:hypothetical protein
VLFQWVEPASERGHAQNAGPDVAHRRSLVLRMLPNLGCPLEWLELEFIIFYKRNMNLFFLKLCFVFLSFGVAWNECQKAYKTSMDMRVDDGLQDNVNTLMPFEL